MRNNKTGDRTKIKKPAEFVSLYGSGVRYALNRVRFAPRHIYGYDIIINDRRARVCRAVNCAINIKDTGRKKKIKTKTITIKTTATGVYRSAVA